ncbi:efflux RND transporter permease subunit [Luteolibacter ambystomatis]|uniref:Efflux RND transporter permease subunit n=1 Tax=Luteolibacter ambystomatis TaxID=2824561 RepID=A0A975J1E0_9BACT|nr:efflux RND transporter permease subunit [Luteolibacter ambystomatis]QUE52189.1 efflux RND transporter permease subunit [Luteolibacter ambystomatis]
MLDKLIRFSLANRAIILGVALLVMVLGVRTATQLPVEVLPDLTKPTVVVLTEAPGLAPEEVESRVTQPIESALSGVGGITRLRSNSDVSLSLVYAEFSWGTDVYRARTLVQERLQGVRSSLPKDSEPFLTPVASLMGEILLVGVRSTIDEGQDGYLAPRDVRTVADWTIKKRLQGIPGVAEVLNMGGGIQQLQVQPDPAKMQAHGVTLEELKAAAEKAAGNTTGGFVNSGSREILIRNLAMTIDPNAIGATVIKRVSDRPVSIRDVADVAWDIEPMRGDASINNTRGVIMSITKSPGFDTITLTKEIEKALAELKPALPKGVEAEPLFRQADFIDHAVGNLKDAIVEGAIMVAIVLFLFLLNFRTTFITLMAMPMSFAITLLIFKLADISVNSMTLGGLAVAIGMVVDDAIVDVENVFRRLKENAARSEPLPRLSVIAKASGEVRNSIFYATVLIVMVFLPLLGLSGVEGRLFSPIAIATIVSMAASFVVSLTTIPVLCSLLLRPKEGKAHEDGHLTRAMKWVLRKTLLKFALDQPYILLAITGALMAGAFLLYPTMGKDFLPAFKEETALVSTTTAPGTSLEQMNQVADVIERKLTAIPEVSKVGRRVGRAERGDHVVPVSTAEFDIDFRSSESGRSRGEILEEIRKTIRTVPGTFSVLTGPLADRIGHMLSGVSAPVAVKIYGPDLDELRRIGTQVQTIAKTIPGFEDAKLDAQSTIPQIRIEPDRDRAFAYSITPGDLNDQLATYLGGEQVAELRDGQRAIDLVVRLPEKLRDKPEKLATLAVETEGGMRVPLGLVAHVQEAKGPNVIQREKNQRRFVVAIKPTVRDVGTVVGTLQQKVAEQVKLPEGYFMSIEGEFEAQREASQRIAILSAVVLVVIVFLLFGYFRSFPLALQVMLNIPLALMGGLAFTWYMIDNISIATLVGFIAVGGVAARNGIMMISHYLHLMRHEGEEFTRQMIERGTLERMVPVFMTALSAGIGLIPLVMAADQPGKEMLHPVAVVITGGLVSSTLLDMAVTPAVFWLFGRKAARRALALDAAAAR